MQLSSEQFEALYGYIEAARQRGHSDQSIMQALKDAGWSDTLIEVGFEAIAHGHSERMYAPMPPPSPSVLDMNNVGKEYINGEEKTSALRGIDLLIRKGDFVAIMGPSGSGKSTLMHILGLLDVPSSGSYRLSGEEVSRLSSSEQAEARNHKVGFVFQQFNLLPRTTVLDNVLLPTIYNHTADARQRAMQLIERVGLSHRINHKSNQLSGGQIQRVAIARALMMNPDIIFADEPTGNLDSKTSEEILELFKEINESGTTIVMVTHEEHIANHAKRIVRLRDGEIVSDKRLS